MWSEVVILVDRKQCRHSCWCQYWLCKVIFRHLILNGNLHIIIWNEIQPLSIISKPCQHGSTDRSKSVPNFRSSATFQTNLYPNSSLFKAFNLHWYHLNRSKCYYKGYKIQNFPYLISYHLSICSTYSKHLYTLYISIILPYFCWYKHKCHFRCRSYRD